MHPSAELHAKKSQKLLGKKIVLGITGSIAAVETVKLARELIRHGADIFPVMSENAQKIIHSDSVWFACGRQPITKLDGSVQHVALCGNVPDRADLLLIAPATANTISKVAHAIDDTPVTTMATTAIGTGIPVIIVPGMHSAMYAHPVVKENIAALKKIGITFVGPVMAENKAKMAAVDEVVANVIRALGPNDLKGRRLLVIAGGFSAPWDAVRSLGSAASGRTGIELAVRGFERGASVKLILAGDAPAPEYILTGRMRTVDELMAALTNLKADIVIMPAAIPDYAPAKVKGKVPSDQKEMVLRLSKLPKVLSLLRKKHRGILVGFKAEHGVGRDELVKRARARLAEYKLDLIVANDVIKVTKDSTKSILVTKKAEKDFSGTKATLAEAVLDEIAAMKK
ncbi:MAG: bifunctional phosphopantothenoylcysteine decarboxylase/phosphopantothenate--cysteine ligase CoaBC [Euryarchaeota archaeon]|nr:bifunctional phosphopantothenoylcysteine decarboxylase/phosphopantothenate--cysteine ligase CoaBC [Euryarchaeota archaeon]